jgi:hypothetical protein
MGRDIAAAGRVALRMFPGGQVGMHQHTAGEASIIAGAYRGRLTSKQARVSISHCIFCTVVQNHNNARFDIFKMLC